MIGAEVRPQETSHENIRVGFVGLRSPFNKLNWSGTPYFTMTELKRRFGERLEVYDTPRLDRNLHWLNKVTSRLGFDIQREPVISRLYSRHIDSMVERHRPDVLVSVGATQKLAAISSDVPIIHVSDALFATITSYYPKYHNFSGRSIRLGNAIQQKVLDKCGALVLSSDWARDSAVKHYDIAPEIVHAIPLGANLPSDPGPDIVARPKDRLRLLFIGMDWNRKGGPQALAIFRNVRRQDPDAEMHIVGCSPQEAQGEPGITVHGVLRKSDEEEARLFDALLRDASFFVLPSLQEAFGLAYCEAAAFGLPAVALRTGGVPTIVKDGETGLLFEKDIEAEAIASRILDLWRDGNRYDAFRAAARKRYEETLTWKAWGDAMELVISRVARSKVSRTGDGG